MANAVQERHRLIEIVQAVTKLVFFLRTLVYRHADVCFADETDKIKGGAFLLSFSLYL
jgi:hypothetical protein